METINNKIQDLVILCQQIKEIDDLIVLSTDVTIKNEYMQYMKELIKNYYIQTSELKPLLLQHFEQNPTCINFSYKKLYKKLYS